MCSIITEFFRKDAKNRRRRCDHFCVGVRLNYTEEQHPHRRLIEVAMIQRYAAIQTASAP
jgi:hypothetical protein